MDMMKLMKLREQNLTRYILLIPTFEEVRSVPFKMPDKQEVQNLYKIYVLLQDLMGQHMIIDAAVKENSVSEDKLDLDTLESAASAIMNICQEIEKDLSPDSRNCCCVSI